jgi:hypothetical protein
MNGCWTSLGEPDRLSDQIEYPLGYRQAANRSAPSRRVDTQASSRHISAMTKSSPSSAAITSQQCVLPPAETGSVDICVNDCHGYIIMAKSNRTTPEGLDLTSSST